MESLVKYFLECQSNHYLIQDRQSDKGLISIAATGFGYYAWTVAVKDNLISKETAISWMNTSIDFIQKITPDKNRGWLYHFITPEGAPKSEVSTIDTALYYLAARKAAKTLSPELEEKVENLIKKIDAKWMLQGNLLRHGLIWENDTPRFLTCCWDDYNEGVLVYRLLEMPFTPAKTQFNLPLFVYYYPLCFYDDQLYKDNLNQAIAWQFQTYGYCGITACDGPHGYCVNNPEIISPLSILACSVWNKQAYDFLQHVDKNISSLELNGTWKTTERIGIDCGSCLMNIEQFT